MGIPDIQKSTDDRGIPINLVGIKGLSYPVKVRDRKNLSQDTIADIEMAVSLKPEQKGTHMSRFIEIIGEFKDRIDITQIPEILKLMQKRLESEDALLKLSFPYFVTKAAPVTGKSSIMRYQVKMEGRICSQGDISMTLRVIVPVTSLCPCSKEISDNGAHNQRGSIDITIIQSDATGKFIWIEELIEYAESSASCPIYPLLKRPDEKYVTEYAYANPAFVEDMARSTVALLSQDDRVDYYTVHAISEESIHCHQAWASIKLEA